MVESTPRKTNHLQGPIFSAKHSMGGSPPKQTHGTGDHELEKPDRLAIFNHSCWLGDLGKSQGSLCGDGLCGDYFATKRTATF